MNNIFVWFGFLVVPVLVRGAFMQNLLDITYTLKRLFFVDASVQGWLVLNKCPPTTSFCGMNAVGQGVHGFFQAQQQD